MAISKVTIIGSGNIAEGLGNFFKAAHIDIVEIYSRNKKTGSALSKKLKAKYVAKIKELSYHSGLYLLAVPDDVIKTVAASLGEKIKSKGKVVHCSGATSSIVLKKSCVNYGVFYPLQTFTKGKRLKAKGVPFCIVTNSNSFSRSLLTLGKKISGAAYAITDAERLKLHLAAVMVNNFTNHLFTLSEEYLVQNNLSFDLLHPLIQETISKALKSSPSLVQTGPAKRGDEKTIAAHIKLLKKHEDLKSLYKQLTESLNQFYIDKK